MNEGRLTRYFRPSEFDKALLILEPGDLIEFDRGCYKHWAVFFGDFEIDGDKSSPCVVHRNNQEDLSFSGISNTFQSTHSLSKACSKGLAAMESLRDVIATSKFRINNTFDSISSPLSIEMIQVRILEKILETGNPYDLISNNCEHFAKWARNGVSDSKQVTDAASDVVFGLGVGLLGAVIGIGVKSLFSNKRRNY